MDPLSAPCQPPVPHLRKSSHSDHLQSIPWEKILPRYERVLKGLGDPVKKSCTRVVDRDRDYYMIGKKRIDGTEELDKGNNMGAAAIKYQLACTVGQ